MPRHGPTRSELRFRLAFSTVGLALLAGALAYRGLPTGAGGWEAVGLGVVFFLGTFIWTARKLLRKEYSDAP